MHQWNSLSMQSYLHHIGIPFVSIWDQKVAFLSSFLGGILVDVFWPFFWVRRVNFFFISVVSSAETKMIVHRKKDNGTGSRNRKTFLMHIRIRAIWNIFGWFSCDESWTYFFCPSFWLCNVEVFWNIWLCARPKKFEKKGKKLRINYFSL